ncbi:MAG TPA: hypothetical protein DG753_13385 [Clostridium sp.]|nr:hypothetical protein [Clostridium sp.]
MIFNNYVLIDFLSYVYQGGVFLYAVSKCLSDDMKKDRIKWVKSFLIFMTLVITLMVLLDGKSNIIIEAHYIGFFLICGTVYKDRLHDAILAYSICYYECLMYSATKYVLFGDRMEFTLGNFMVASVLMAIYLYGLKSVVEVYDNIKNKTQYRFLIIILSFVVDIFLILTEVLPENKMRLLELFIFKGFVIFFIFYLIFCMIRYIKVKKMVKLNFKLNYVNKELKKIKDCHGNAINEMNTLFKEGKIEEVGERLKDIINSNNGEVSNVEVNNEKSSSMLHMTLAHAIKDGVNVNIDERYSLELADIDKMELYRIILNITNNARRFAGKGGIINAKTYREEDNIIIIIENNGPKIEEDQLENIFKLGFTTKRNYDRSHGFGLNIVKELVEKNNGHIEVSSTDLITGFKITLPCD